jgi:hypothetical protein
MRRILILPALLLFSTLALSQEVEQKSVAVTVYNQNIGVIKDVRSFDIKKGESEISLTDVAQFMDPTSVKIKFNGEAIEQNYQYDLASYEKIFSKYLNKPVQLVDKEGQLIDGKLISAIGSSVVLQKADGGLIMIPNTSEYKVNVAALPEGLIVQPTLIWKINSNAAGKQDVEVSYQTNGLNWTAEYVAVLNEDDTQLDLNSWVSIENNSGATYKNAKLKLVAGDVNIAKEEGVDYNARGGEVYMMAAKAAPQFEEKEFFEYHIYELQRPSTIANYETKQISLFEAEGIKAVKKYKYKSGGAQIYRGGNYVNESKVNVEIEFKNSPDNNMGMPMPKGRVRLYKSDGKSLELIGEDRIDHTPKNGDVNLAIGNAFDITAAEKQTDHRKISDKVEENTYEITLKNSKKQDVTVEVEKNLGLNWEIMKNSLGYEKKDAYTVLFKVPVKADGETKLTFTVRYNY